MARSKGTPERSKLVRAPVVAFARRQTAPGEGDADDKKPDTAEARNETNAPAKGDAKVEKPEAKLEPKPDAKLESKPEAKAPSKPEAKAPSKPEAQAPSKPETQAPSKPEAQAKPEAKPEAPSKPEAKPEAKTPSKADAQVERPEAKVEPKLDPAPKADDPSDAIPTAAPSADTKPVVARPDPGELPEIDPPEPRAEPWPDATPPPMKPVAPAADDLRVSRTATVGMSVSNVGRPPDMPRAAAPPPLALGSVEDPTHMPGPRDVPSGNPEDPAPAPGRVPPGDSRSLRRGNEFALVYRVGTCVISRAGTIGTRGQWRVVEYPTSASASNAYAKECSRFVSEGFSDYRD